MKSTHWSHGQYGMRGVSLNGNKVCVWAAWSGHALRLKWLEVYTHAHTHQMQPECTRHADSCPISPCQPHDRYCYNYTCCPPALRLWHHPEGSSLLYELHFTPQIVSMFWHLKHGKSNSKWCKCLSQGTCNNSMLWTTTLTIYFSNSSQLFWEWILKTQIYMTQLFLLSSF